MRARRFILETNAAPRAIPWWEPLHFRSSPRFSGNSVSFRGLPPSFRDRTWSQDPDGDDPRALASLMLAAISLGSAFFCVIGLVGGPFAIAMARSSLKNIKESNGRIGGRRSALAGYILGTVATVLFILLALFVLGVFGPVTLKLNYRLRA